jgi:Spy/CpxP family protein refolding chaperone
MQRWQRVAVVLALVGLAGGAALAMGGAHRGRFSEAMINNRVNHMLDVIDATPQQRQVINQVKDDLVAQFKAKAAQRAQNRTHWIDVLSADQLDTAALYAEADRRAQDVRDMAQVIVPAIQKVHDILTPAQRQKLAAMAKQHSDTQGGFGGPTP